MRPDLFQDVMMHPPGSAPEDVQDRCVHSVDRARQRLRESQALLARSRALRDEARRLRARSGERRAAVAGRLDAARHRLQHLLHLRAILRAEYDRLREMAAPLSHCRPLPQRQARRRRVRGLRRRRVRASAGMVHCDWRGTGARAPGPHGRPGSSYTLDAAAQAA